MNMLELPESDVNIELYEPLFIDRRLYNKSDAASFL